MKKYKYWHGNISNDIDNIVIEPFDRLITGRYGGTSKSGAYKNEDGFIVIKPCEDSLFTVIFDAHTSNDSVVLITDMILSQVNEIITCCQLPIKQSIIELQHMISSMLLSVELENACQSMIGETAVLFCFQKNEYLWWLSVGDNSLYLFNHELAELGQYRLNQRVFYQWVGKANSMTLDIPCYSSGTIHLREGINKILLMTDGLLEIEDEPFEDNSRLYDLVMKNSMEETTKTMLETVKEKNGRDNATMLLWSVTCNHKPLRPTR